MVDTKPSKSARKREYQALQALGEQLILLADDELASIDTDDHLIDQVRAAKKIIAHGALRRQKQLIGKIMRDVDPEPIRAALVELGRTDRHDKAVFKRAERWRDRIAAEGRQGLLIFEAETEGISELLERCVADLEGTTDAMHRRQISRKIFREIHRILAEQ